MPLLQPGMALPGIAKLITAPQSEVTEDLWQAQVEGCLQWAEQARMVLEWRLGFATIPQFLRAEYGTTLEGLAQTAVRLAGVSAQRLPGAIMLALDVPHPLYAYRFVAARLASPGAYPAITSEDRAIAGTSRYVVSSRYTIRCPAV